MNSVDVAIIGSGFSGSILARILSSRGLSVLLIDPQTHPRFAIGESSTPIADAMLRRLGSRYDCDDLISMSTWGSWRRAHADLDCGCKRGFSYFAHQLGKPFAETRLGERSMVAAASQSDDLADTHWYRPDVDEYLFRRAIEAGAIDRSGSSVVAIDRVDNRWRLTIQSDRCLACDADWVIDASGQASVIAKLFNLPNQADRLRTRTHSIFGHFVGVKRWSEISQTEPTPFDCDDAAQHHLLGDGWMWMLRFASGLTSVGYTAPTGCELDWSGFPSIDAMMGQAKLVAPIGGPRRTTRLQRWFDPIAGERALMLPTAALTLDPLHSTGIAHALAGVERVSHIILQSDIGAMAVYSDSFRRETMLLDRLVATAYAVMSDFPRFTTACMLYFAGAIGCEESLQRGETPSALWTADDDAFVSMIFAACDVIEDRSTIDSGARVRDMLAPWNRAGLMNAAVQNRYAYTATK